MPLYHPRNKEIEKKEKSGVVYTRDESLWSWLGDAQTCRTILDLAYMLCHLTTT